MYGSSMKMVYSGVALVALLSLCVVECRVIEDKRFKSREKDYVAPYTDELGGIADIARSVLESVDLSLLDNELLQNSSVVPIVNVSSTPVPEVSSTAPNVTVTPPAIDNSTVPYVSTTPSSQDNSTSSAAPSTSSSGNSTASSAADYSTESSPSSPRPLPGRYIVKKRKDVVSQTPLKKNRYDGVVRVI